MADDNASTPAPTSTPETSEGITPQDFRSRLRSGQPINDSISDDDNDSDEDSSTPPKTKKKAATRPAPTVDSDADTEDEETTAGDLTELLEGAEEPDEEESEDEVEEDEDGWPEELKAYKEIHGLPLAKIAEALAAGKLPDELMNVLKVHLKDGDLEWDDTIDGARRAAMHRKNYTRKTQAHAKEVAEWNVERNEFIGMVTNWSDPKLLKEGLTRMNFPFLEAAQLLAEEHRMLNAMTPEQREIYEAKQQLAKEKAEWQREQNRLKQAKEAETGTTIVQKNVDFVSNTAPNIFQGVGLPMNKGTWGVFLREFDNISKSQPGSPWTAEMIQLAVELTKDEYDDLHRQMGETTPAKPKTSNGAPSPARAAVAKSGLGGTRFDSSRSPSVKNKNGITIDQFRKLVTGR